MNLVIEFDGDFYHCNPVVYKEGPKYQCQIDKLKKDEIKNSYLETHNIPYLRIWEFDFNHNKDLVRQKLEESIKLAKEKLNK